jgi:hypothetical protein
MIAIMEATKISGRCSNTATGAALPLLNYMNPYPEYFSPFLDQPTMSG